MRISSNEKDQTPDQRQPPAEVESQNVEALVKKGSPCDVQENAVTDEPDIEKLGGSGGREAQPPPLSKWRTIALVATVTGAAFMNTLSVQAAVVILPTIGRDLNIPTARQQWVRHPLDDNSS